MSDSKYTVDGTTLFDPYIKERYTLSSSPYATIEEKNEWWSANHPYSNTKHQDIKTEQEFEHFYQELTQQSGMVFRGVNNALYKMFTSLQVALLQNRIKGNSSITLVQKEIELIRVNKDTYCDEGKLPRGLENVDILFMSFMQHFGLYTPCLDFSHNLKKALFFAWDKFQENNSDYVSIYWFQPNQIVTRNRQLLSNPIFQNVATYPIEPNKLMSIIPWFTDTLCDIILKVIDWIKENENGVATDNIEPLNFLKWCNSDNLGEGLCKLELGYLADLHNEGYIPKSFATLKNEFENIKDLAKQDVDINTQLQNYITDLAYSMLYNLKLSNINLERQEGCFLFYNPLNPSIPLEDYWHVKSELDPHPDLNCANINKEVVKKCIEPLLKREGITHDFMYPQGCDEAKRDFKQLYKEWFDE